MRLKHNYKYQRAEAIDEVREALDNSPIDIDVDAVMELVSEVMDQSIVESHTGSAMYGHLQSQDYRVMASLGDIVQVQAMTQIL